MSDETSKALPDRPACPVCGEPTTKSQAVPNAWDCAACGNGVVLDPIQDRPAPAIDQRRWTLYAHHVMDPIVRVESGFHTLKWGETIEVVPASERDRLAGEVEELREKAQQLRDVITNASAALRMALDPAPALDETGETT